MISPGDQGVKIMYDFICIHSIFLTQFIITEGNAHIYSPIYHQVSNTRRILERNWIVDCSDVAGASPVGAAPTTSSFST